MPTFPRYEGSVNVATPNTPMNPTESIRAKQLEGLGKGVEQVGLAGSQVATKFKEIRDTTDAAAAYQTAVDESEKFIEGLKGLEAQDARKKYDEFIQQNQARWYKGLSKEAAFKLQYDLFPKQLENAGLASKIGFRYETDKAGATMAAREVAWQKNINNRRVYGDPALDKEYLSMQRDMDVYVANGLYSQKDAEEWKKRVLANGAYDQAYREAHANPEAFRAEYKKYQSEKGANRAPHAFDHIPEKQLAILDGEARQQMWSDKEHEHTEILWKRQEQDRVDDERREQDEKDMGRLADKKMLTMGKVEEYASNRRVTGEKAEWWRARVRGDLLEGGTPNTEVYRAYTWKVTEALSGSKTTAELSALQSELYKEGIARNIPRKQVETWAAELSARMRAEDTPERRRSTEAKSLLHKMLAPTDGKFSQTGKERDVEVEYMKLIADNEKKQGSADYQDPVDMIHGKQGEIRAKAGQGGPAVNQARVETNVGAAPKEGAPDEGVHKRLEELEQTYRTDPDPKKREEAAKKILEIKRRVVVPTRENAEAKKRQEEYNRQRKEMREQGKLSAPPPVAPPTSLTP